MSDSLQATSSPVPAAMQATRSLQAMNASRSLMSESINLRNATRVEELKMMDQFVSSSPAPKLELHPRFMSAHSPQINARPAPRAPLSTGPSALSKVLAPVAIVGGGAQLVEGVQTAVKGDSQMGGIQATEGAASLGSGAAMLAGRVVLGGALGGVAAAADGVSDMVQGGRNGDSEQTGVGAAKTLGGVLMAGGAAHLNPISVGGGAVIYGGAVAYENRQMLADGARWVADQSTSAMRNLAAWALPQE